MELWTLSIDRAYGIDLCGIFDSESKAKAAMAEQKKEDCVSYHYIINKVTLNETY